MKRRDFIAGTSIAALAAIKPFEASAQTNAGFALAEATIAGLAARMQSGRDSAVSIAQRYLQRISVIDKAVNAVIELNPDALRIARELDEERRQKRPRGPLHGIPVLIKDNIDTADRMMTSAGSLALAGSSAPQDAGIVRKLRAAGAVILGKTNMSEWANFRSTHSVSGWSGRGGQTRNPYALDRNPCGSSSGTGAGVSANLCALGIGTETDGSIVCPAAMNGIVGIKPTLGLWSGSGIVPIAHSQDTAGPMARTLRDAAILLGALSEKDTRDYTTFLDANGLRGARLGVARKFMGMNAAVDKLMEELIAEMKRHGAEIADPADLPSKPANGPSPEHDVLVYEFKADLNNYLAGRGPHAPVKTLKDVIAFNEAHHDREMPWFGQELMIEAESKGPLSEQAYRDALAASKKSAREDGIDGVLKKFHVDAIIAPTAGPSWLIDWVNGDQDTGGCSTPAAVAGYPHITVPAGFVNGLPIGMSFYGPAWSEGALLKIAYGFEQAVKARREPRFLKTLPLTPPASRS